MEEKMQQLKTTLATLADLAGAGATLSWDQQTYMPPAAAESRGEQTGTLGRLAHEIITSQELGRLLEDLKLYAAGLDPDSDDARMIKFAIRDHDLAMRLPAEFVVEQAEVTALASQAWAEARQKSDFSIFHPLLEKIMDLTHRYIGFFPPANHP